MGKRLLVVLFVGFAGAVAWGSAANAGPVQDRIARHQAEVKAKIAAKQAARSQPATVTETQQARPAAPRSAPVRSGKSIDISIGEQRLRAYEGDRVVMDTPVSTGARGYETPTGRYRVQTKEENHWSRSYHVWMPWAMQVVGGIFIHELPVTTDGRRLGTNSLGRPVSHGCIRVGVGPAKQLWDWAEVGTPVTIH
jgi:lipoprotein-anchoring transpeptidase ErfK/SrfK